MIKFIVDSTSCVPKEYAKKHDITVVGLTTTIDDYVLEEGFEDGWNEFYETLKASKNFPKTSQPTPAMFESAYNKILKKHPESKIIVLTLSQSLSGTYNSALLASKSMPENKVFVVDSGQTGQSQLLFLEELVELQKQGKTAEELVKESETIKEKVCITFVPQTIEYLKRGGRINLLKATLVNLLNIKPILAFKAGVLTNTKKAIGMQKAINEVVADIPKNIKKLYVIYVHESPFVQTMLQKVNQALSLNLTETKKISPVVGSHVGIGAVGLAYVTF